MATIFFGIPPGVSVGDTFNDRMSLVEHKLHRNTQRGIDGNGSDGSSAIVVSGGYVDDYDLGDEILYTGEGGNDPVTGRQIAHQSIYSPGNAGLIKSMQERKPVRVIRSSNHNSPFSPRSGYRFDGLFYVQEYQLVTGKDGFKIIQFNLRNTAIIDEELVVKKGCIVDIEYNINGVVKRELRSLGVIQGPFKEIRIDSNYANAILGKKIGESFGFGQISGVIKNIKKYLS